MNPFNVEHQYQEYLQRIGLIESEMHPEQCRQLKEAFYAGFGQCLLTNRDKVGALDHIKAVATLESMLQQCVYFWQTITSTPHAHRKSPFSDN